MRVLVTGAKGFVGRQVCRSLKDAGHTIIAVSRHEAEESLESTTIQANLTVAGEAARVVRISKPDTIVHLGWTVEHGRFWNDPANHDWLAASLELARTAAEIGVRRFVGVGTCFEYDWPADRNCYENSTPLIGHTLYDISKSKLRLALDCIFSDAGVSFAWARLFNLYGSQEHPNRLVADLARQVIAGSLARCSTGLILRDYIDVRDAGDAIAALVISGVIGSVNIASGQAVSIADIARMIGKIAGRPELIEIGGRPDRVDDPPRIVADIGRLKREVGYFSKIDLHQGLTEEIMYWKKQN